MYVTVGSGLGLELPLPVGISHPHDQGSRARSLAAWPSSSVRSASCHRA